MTSNKVLEFLRNKNANTDQRISVANSLIRNNPDVDNWVIREKWANQNALFRDKKKRTFFKSKSEEQETEETTVIDFATYLSQNFV